MTPPPLHLSSSPTTLAITLITLTTIFYLIRKIHHALTSPLRHLPGPPWSHTTHLPLKLATLLGRRTQYIHALHTRHGPILRLTPTEVAVADAAAARNVIHKPGGGFVKAAWYGKFVGSGAAAGMFDMRDARAHAARRRVFARAFGKGEVRGRWEGMVKEKVGRAVGRMGEEMRGREGECDVLKWWTFVATDVSAHLMFGESFRMVELGEKNEYIHVLESTMLGSGIRTELPLVAAIGKLIPHPKLQAMFNANARLLDYGTRAVTSSKARGADGGGGGGSSIFAQLAADEQQQQKLSDLEMRTEAGNFIVAGADTTAVSLTYLTYAVLARPALQRELEAEVARLPPAFGDVDCEALPLLCAVVNETLRLYGAAPGSLPRTVPRGGVELGGYFVPEGVTVSTQAWTLHRDEGLWVDAESFNPQRWFELPLNTSPSSMRFAPFGTGTRVCLGLHLALMELRLATAVFFRELRGARLSEKTTPESMDVVNYFLIRPKSGRCYIKL